jgi:hypothetical protein
MHFRGQSAFVVDKAMPREIDLIDYKGFRRVSIHDVTEKHQYVHIIRITECIFDMDDA